jgi:hypothetical protein
MKKTLILATLLLLLVTACAGDDAGPEVTVFRAPT